jgi:cytosine/adenosine deaminase-related metal-dependent hydrolase
VITPGLVNAHTHLTLTDLAGAVPPMPFTEWLPALVSAMKPWTVADHEASGAHGARQCLLAGVSVVGDIAYGAAEVVAAASLGLGGVYYWELLGMQAGSAAGELDALRYPQQPEQYGPRVTCGLSPHSPYTSGPELLQTVHALAAEKQVPMAIHVAESKAEVDLLCSGTGPLAAVAGRTAYGFRPPGVSTVRYLHELGVLAQCTAVHCCHVDSVDTALLAEHARGVVTCPRSNCYLGNPIPEVGALLAAGISVGIGTDSSASNWDLDLMAEARALRSEQPRLSARTLLDIVTRQGARAIGVDARFGTLEPGKQADLAVFALGDTAEPEEAVVSRAGADTLSALLAGGTWRVREGSLLAR